MVDAGRPGKFTLDDFRRLLDRAQRSGPPGKRMGSLPGVSTAEAMVEQNAQEHLRRVQGIIDAMTPEERQDPERVLDESRLRRIAAGAGVDPREVRDLARRFRGIAEIMDQLPGSGPRGDGPGGAWLAE